MADAIALFSGFRNGSVTAGKRKASEPTAGADVYSAEPEEYDKAIMQHPIETVIGQKSNILVHAVFFTCRFS